MMISFPSQMILEPLIGQWAWIGSSDVCFILVWKELKGWIFVGGLF